MRVEDIVQRIYRIHDVELLSTGWTTRNYPSAIGKLDSIAKNAHSLIGIVAYHTLWNKGPMTAAKNLLSCLKTSESYCVSVGTNPQISMELMTSPEWGLDFMWTWLSPLSSLRI